ncbi:hypothetical protein GCM10022393_40140 [Aquimarina addita]|uniref:GLPGLI family protein n=1 Tax=Aquimarina addita TaxID=870485 RepID=A0ABP6UWC0_9FLAO
MKQINLLITIFLCINFGFSQTVKKIINGTEFKIITVTINENEQTEFIELYRNNNKLLTHILSNFDGDCSSENIELGEYEIKDSKLIFYSYWASGDRMMKNIYPYGFRKQIYLVNEKGFVSLESSKLYIETYVDEWNEHKGMKFLKIKPKTDSETELMNDYISKAEKMYFGNFVFGDHKNILENEVRKKIGETIIENTKYWKEVYGENCRM